MNTLAVDSSLGSALRETGAPLFFPLAQIPAPSPGSIESWLWAFAALCAVAVLFKTLFVRKPPIEAEFATKADLAALKTELQSLRSDFDARLDANNKSGEARASGIHKRINDVFSAVDEMRGTIKLLLNPPPYFRSRHAETSKDS